MTAAPAAASRLEWREGEYSRFLALYESGASAAAIGRELERNERWVYRRLAALELPLPSEADGPRESRTAKVQATCTDAELLDLRERMAAAGYSRVGDYVRALLWPRSGEGG